MISEIPLSVDMSLDMGDGDFNTTTGEIEMLESKRGSGAGGRTQLMASTSWTTPFKVLRRELMAMTMVYRLRGAQTATTAKWSGHPWMGL